MQSMIIINVSISSGIQRTFFNLDLTMCIEQHDQMKRAVLYAPGPLLSRWGLRMLGTRQS